VELVVIIRQYSAYYPETCWMCVALSAFMVFTLFLMFSPIVSGDYLFYTVPIFAGDWGMAGQYRAG
jgi:hypothetical protein